MGPQRTLRCAIVLGLAGAALGSLVPIPYFESRAEAQGVASAQCLQIVMRNVPQVPERERGSSFAIAVSSEDLPTFRELGLLPVKCATVRDIESLAKFRDRVCQMAGDGGDLIQLQFERALGVAPARLCASAQKVAKLSVTQILDAEASTAGASE
jgi:hypothetical protein